MAATLSAAGWTLRVRQIGELGADHPGQYTPAGTPFDDHPNDRLLDSRDITDPRPTPHFNEWIRTPEQIHDSAVTLGRAGGQARTAAQRAASRANGTKGGRPRQTP